MVAEGDQCGRFRGEGTSVRTHQSPVLCRWNLHHVWENAHTSDGQRFIRCSRCLKERWSNPKGTGPVAGPSLSPWGDGKR
jgi:hypothetical protein